MLDFERFQLWNDCAPVGLVVEILSGDAENIGLTGERLRTTVESRLRGARIYTNDILPAYLYLNVNVAGQGFAIGLAFRKSVMDRASLIGYATTWNTGAAGTYVDAGFILQGVAEHTDRFINEYLRVNASACK